MTNKKCFREDLCRELYPISIRNFALEMKLYELAWEHGHSHGEAEVLSYYADFAEAAQAGINAALGDNQQVKA